MAVSAYEKEICNSEHRKLAKICQGFGKYSNEMARGALVKWRILAKMESLTNSAESGKNEYSGIFKWNGKRGPWKMEILSKMATNSNGMHRGAPFKMADSQKVV